jgi:hypothetical protein
LACFLKYLISKYLPVGFKIRFQKKIEVNCATNVTFIDVAFAVISQNLEAVLWPYIARSIACRVWNFHCLLLVGRLVETGGRLTDSSSLGPPLQPVQAPCHPFPSFSFIEVEL